MSVRVLSGLLLATLLIVAAIDTGSAALEVMPVIERPTLTASQAIAIAGKQLRDDQGPYLLVSVDWAEAGKFRPIHRRHSLLRTRRA